MTNKLNIGVFELGLKHKGKEQDNLMNCLKLAKKVENLGYSRFWIGEHLGSDIAWKSTDIMASLLAAYTDSIRIGSAGILTYYHSEYWCSHNYLMLRDFFGDRIDLGLSKGKSLDIGLHLELSAGAQCDNAEFRKKASKIKSYLTAEDKYSPELWILGSTLSNLEFAFDKGMNFALSLCHSETTENIASEISEFLSKEKVTSEKNFKVILLVNLVCAKTSSQAEGIAKNRSHGNLGIPHFGNPGECEVYLKALQSEYGVNEIIVVTPCHEQDEKEISYQLLAAEMKLTGFKREKNKIL